MIASLPSTATRDQWRAVYTPTVANLLGRETLVDGVLTVTEWTGSRKPREIVDTYEVQHTPLVGAPGRAFLLVKTDHRGDLDTKKGQEAAKRIGQTYKVELLADGRHFCTCTGGLTEKARVGAPCLHVLGLREVVQAEIEALVQKGEAKHTVTSLLGGDEPARDDGDGETPADPGERADEMDAHYGVDYPADDFDPWDNGGHYPPPHDGDIPTRDTFTRGRLAYEPLPC